MTRADIEEIHSNIVKDLNEKFLAPWIRDIASYLYQTSSSTISSTSSSSSGSSTNQLELDGILSTIREQCEGPLKDGPLNMFEKVKFEDVQPLFDWLLMPLSSSVASNGADDGGYKTIVESTINRCLMNAGKSDSRENMRRQLNLLSTFIFVFRFWIEFFIPVNPHHPVTNQSPSTPIYITLYEDFHRYITQGEFMNNIQLKIRQILNKENEILPSVSCPSSTTNLSHRSIHNKIRHLYLYTQSNKNIKNRNKSLPYAITHEGYDRCIEIILFFLFILSYYHTPRLHNNIINNDYISRDKISFIITTLFQCPNDTKGFSFGITGKYSDMGITSLILSATHKLWFDDGELKKKRQRSEITSNDEELLYLIKNNCEVFHNIASKLKFYRANQQQQAHHSVYSDELIGLLLNNQHILQRIDEIVNPARALSLKNMNVTPLERAEYDEETLNTDETRNMESATVSFDTYPGIF